jgi:HD-GYP domain-containing protein (c-di-GMP phosphodiesterase class II)
MDAPPRLAELLSALSLATDLGTGLPPETSVRTAVLATLLARRLGLVGAELASVYWAGILRHLGCTAWAHEGAALVGDDHELIRAFEGVDRGRRASMLDGVGRLAPGRSLPRRARAMAAALTHPRAGGQLIAAQCAQAAALASDLGCAPAVSVALGQMYERHDGRGDPHGLAGEAIAPAARILHAAQVIEALYRRGGAELVERELRARRGGQFAPAVCDAALADRDWTAALDAADPSEQFLAAEPAPRRHLVDLDGIARAFARFVDLKSPHTLGHSTAVAELAASAGRIAGWTEAAIAAVRRAALLHDLGAVSVGNGVWDRAGALGIAAWEQVRLHAYHGERILARSPLTAPLAPIVGGHHERLDGSGYHRSARAAAIDPASRVLATADVLAALRADRPHRPALAEAAAARVLTDEATAGRLCRDAVAWVLAAAGRPIARAPLPAALTEREAEVLGLIAIGAATKDIARTLGITVRTVKHHIEHIYAKTGAQTRVAAALFAARHELVGWRA